MNSRGDAGRKCGLTQALSSPTAAHGADASWSSAQVDAAFARRARRWLVLLLSTLTLTNGCGPSDEPGATDPGEGVPTAVTVEGPGHIRTADDTGCEDGCTLYLPEGEPVEIMAVAEDGRGFVEWSGDCAPFANPCRLVPSGGESITATFAPASLRMEVTGEGVGTFRVQPPGVDCDESCGIGLDNPLDVAITITEWSDDTELGEWGGSCEGAARGDYCVVSVDGETNVSKHWVRPPNANDDQFETDQDTRLEVEPGNGVLSNDENVGEGDWHELTAEAVSMPEHGALDLRSDGSFSYEPEEGFVGSDTFTYRARDAHGATSSTASVTVEVLSTNEAPSFQIPNDTVERNAPVEGTQEEPRFAQEIDPGAPDEADQALSFEVERVAGDAPPFATGPSISEDGTLRFEPAGPGTAEFSAVLVDELGASSDPKSFTIVVLPQLTLEKTGRGRVTSSPAGIECGLRCTTASANFPPNEIVTLTAEEIGLGPFQGWGGACSGTEPSCEVTLSSNAKVEAFFFPFPAPPEDGSP